MRMVRWPAPTCMRVCMRERAVVVNARNIGVHCGGQAKPLTGSCVLDLREKMLLSPKFRSWVFSRGVG